MSQLYTIWHPHEPEPNKNIENISVHRGEKDQYEFLLGASIEVLNETLFAAWGNSRKKENDKFSVMAGKKSYDKGQTWKDFTIIAHEAEEGYCHSHGVLCSANNELWAFVPKARFHHLDHFPDLKVEGYRYDLKNDKWLSQGTLINEKFWPLCRPEKLPQGGLMMAGLYHDAKYPNSSPAVAICEGTDLTQWEIISLPRPNGIGDLWGEASVFTHGNDIWLVSRYEEKQIAVASVSHDNGRTWAPLRETNFPMSSAKISAGTLSSGHHYIVHNLKTSAYREKLAISLSKPDQILFEKTYLIKDGYDRDPRFACGSHQFAYPYTLEFEGKLYIIYAVNKEDCDLSILSLKDIRFS